MEKIAAIIEKTDRIILDILKFVTVSIFIVISLILSANIFIRFVPVVSLHWLDEIIELLFASLIFYGSAALWITKGHFSAGDWLSGLIASRRLKYLYRSILEVMVLIFIFLFLYYSYNLYSRAFDVTNALAIPKKVLYFCMPLSGLIMTVYSLKNFVIEISGVFNPEIPEKFKKD